MFVLIRAVIYASLFVGIVLIYAPASVVKLTPQTT